MSCHAASLCFEVRNNTKLVPPATDAPGPFGPGNGIVPQEFATSGGKRLRNSAMFQGPLT